MTVPFVDAETEPNANQALYAFSRGFRACGFYLASSYPYIDPAHGWSVAAVNLLKSESLIPFPIWVPKPALTDSPQDSANAAFDACKEYGLWPGDTVLYNGNHIYASGSMWLPGVPVPPTIPSQTAYQYAQTNISGWSVDVNVAADDFNFNHLVVDFEFNTVGGSRGVSWYTIFRQTIQSLSKEVPSVGAFMLDPQTPGDPSYVVLDGTYLQVVDVKVVGELINSNKVIQIPADHEMILDAAKYIPTPGLNT